MNRNLMFPLTLMFIISIFVSVSASIEPTANSQDFQSTSGITLTQEDGKEVSANVDITGAESTTVDIWNAETGVLIIVTIALAVGVVAGIKVLGSGLDDLSHKMIFLTIFYMSLWGCLTIVSRTLMFENWVTSFLWLGTTMMFAIGLISEISD